MSSADQLWGLCCILSLAIGVLVSSIIWSELNITADKIARATSVCMPNDGIETISHDGIVCANGARFSWEER